MEFELFENKYRITDDGMLERYWGERWDKKRPPCWKPVKSTKQKSTGYWRFVIWDKQRKCKNILHHRLVYYAYNQDWDIWDTGKHNIIDHKDGDKDNNKIGNLHKVTQQQNTFNRQSLKGYTIVGGKYKATINKDGKTHYLGYFETAEEATNAYLKAKEYYHHL